MVKRKAYSEEEELDIATMYDAPNRASTVEKHFGISTSDLYRILHKHNVVPHSKRKTLRDFAGVVTNSAAKEVVVDKEDFVQEVRLAPINGRVKPVWKIRFSGTLIVEADDIFDALKEAKKMKYVERIYSAEGKEF